MKRVLGHRCGTSVVLALAQRPQVRCNHPQLPGTREVRRTTNPPLENA
jgi:hypothetical protein